jgi:hypothetical protein
VALVVASIIAAVTVGLIAVRAIERFLELGEGCRVGFGDEVKVIVPLRVASSK